MQIRDMNAQVIQMAPIPIVMVNHTGPYDGISPVFDQLWNWITAHNIPAQRTIGIYYDNPDEVPANRLRSAACFELPLGYQLTATGGLQVALGQIAGGNYATMRYVGPYENMGPVWSQFTSYVEGPMGRRISENPAFEVYVNDASETPPEQLITELYLPVY